MPRSTPRGSDPHPRIEKGMERREVRMRVAYRMRGMGRRGRRGERAGSRGGAPAPPRAGPSASWPPPPLAAVATSWPPSPITGARRRSSDHRSVTASGEGRVLPSLEAVAGSFRAQCGLVRRRLAHWLVTDPAISPKKDGHVRLKSHPTIFHSN